METCNSVAVTHSKLLFFKASLILHASSRFISRRAAKTRAAHHSVAITSLWQPEDALRAENWTGGTQKLEIVIRNLLPLHRLLKSRQR